MLKRYQFTKYGVVYALISLIPLVPVFGIMPGFALAMGVEKLGTSCEVGYQIALMISIIIAILIVIIYPKLLDRILAKHSKSVALHFGMVSVILYVMVSTIAFIMSVGVTNCCHGDGQTGLAVFFSAPYATVALALFGMVVDFKKKTTNSNNS